MRRGRHSNNPPQQQALNVGRYIMRVYIIIPESNDFTDVAECIKRSLNKFSVELVEKIEDVSDDLLKGINDINLQRLHKMIEEVDVVLADISTNNPSVIYELGVVRSWNKPVVLLSSTGFASASQFEDFHISYDRLRLRDTLSAKLERIFGEFSYLPKITTSAFDEIKIKEPKKVFVSYSHTDKEVLHELRPHLKPFVTDYLIELWDDEKVLAGADWKKEIETTLKKCAIAILLISVDFLASDFITKYELPPLLEAAERGGTTIIPVIVGPCGFLRNPELSRFKAINDPKKPLDGMSKFDRRVEYEKIADIVASML